MDVNTLNEYINKLLLIDDIKTFSSIDMEKLENFRPREGMSEQFLFK